MKTVYSILEEDAADRVNLPDPIIMTNGIFDEKEEFVNDCYTFTPNTNLMSMWDAFTITDVSDIINKLKNKMIIPEDMSNFVLVGLSLLTFAYKGSWFNTGNKFCIYGVSESEIFTRINKFIRDLYNAHENVEKFIYTRNARSINININDIKYSIDLVYYKNKSDIIHNAENGSVNIGFDGDNIIMSRLAKFSISNRVCIIDPSRHDALYLVNIGYLESLGFGIIMPHLDTIEDYIKQDDDSYVFLNFKYLIILIETPNYKLESKKQDIKLIMESFEAKRIAFKYITYDNPLSQITVSDLNTIKLMKNLHNDPTHYVISTNEINNIDNCRPEIHPINITRYFSVIKKKILKGNIRINEIMSIITDKTKIIEYINTKNPQVLITAIDNECERIISILPSLIPQVNIHFTKKPEIIQTSYEEWYGPHDNTLESAYYGTHRKGNIDKLRLEQYIIVHDNTYG